MFWMQGDFSSEDIDEFKKGTLIHLHSFYTWNVL